MGEEMKGPEAGMTPGELGNLAEGAGERPARFSGLSPPAVRSPVAGSERLTIFQVALKKNVQ